MTKLNPKKNAKKKKDLSISKRKLKPKIKAKGSIMEKKKVPQKKQNKVNEGKSAKQLKTKKKIKDSQPKLSKKSSEPNVDAGLKKKKLSKKGEQKQNSNEPQKIAKKKNAPSVSKTNKKPKIKAKGSIAQKKKVPQRKQIKAKKGNDVKQPKSKPTNLDASLMRKFRNIRKLREKERKQDRNEFSDPSQLVSLETIHQAISGIRKLRAMAEKEKSGNSLLDASGDDSFIYLQVTISKMPYVVRDQHLIKPITIKTYLPNSLVKDETEVILITRDLERGIRPDHEPTLHFYQDLLRKHNAASLVSEIIPLRQLKVEYKEFEAKMNLSRRVDVVLCDDTVIRFVPKFLGKHFYNKRKSPVQVNLKAKDLHHELKCALSVSQLIFTMKGNNALMKVGCLGHTDEAVAENIMAAVKKLANYVPGKWKNIHNLSLKLEKSKSIPFYVNLGSLNDVGVVHPRTSTKSDPVSGTLSTLPKKCVTVYPDGSITIRSLKNTMDRIPVEEKEQPKKVTQKLESEQKVEKKINGEVETGEENNETEKLETRKCLKDQASETEVKNAKRKGKASKKAKKQKLEITEEVSEPGKKRKTKKQKVSKEEDSDSGEEELEAQEIAYLKKKNEQEGESGMSAEEEEGSETDNDSDPWDEDSDYGVAGSDEELI